MADPILLYSTNTKLAYMVSERFYGNVHYVWCNPFFDPETSPFYSRVAPPTSNPAEIYRALLKESKGSDLHGQKIAKNRIGIIGGARHMCTNGATRQ